MKMYFSRVGDLYIVEHVINMGTKKSTTKAGCISTSYSLTRSYITGHLIMLRSVLCLLGMGLRQQVNKHNGVKSPGPITAIGMV